MRALVIALVSAPILFWLLTKRRVRILGAGYDDEPRTASAGEKIKTSQSPSARLEGNPTPKPCGPHADEAGPERSSDYHELSESDAEVPRDKDLSQSAA